MRPTNETYKWDLQMRPTNETYKWDLQMRPTKATQTHLFEDIKTDPETKETLKRHLFFPTEENYTEDLPTRPKHQKKLKYLFEGIEKDLEV